MSWLWGKKDQESAEENLAKEEKENDSHAAIEEISEENSPSDGNKNQDDKHERSDDHIDIASGDASLNEKKTSSHESSENYNSHDEDNNNDDDDDDDTNDSLVETDDEEEHDGDISIIDNTSQYTDDNSIDIDDLFSSDYDDDDDEEEEDDDDDDDEEDGDGDGDNEQVSSLSEKKDMSNNTGQDTPTTKNPIHNNKNNANAKYQPTENDETYDEEEEEEEDDEDVPTSFWEKQSLLVLAAEHDRVDILKALLTDENEEKDTLMNSGIPPLHLAISFGSVNTAQSLLRMGADPSIRPDIDKVSEDRKNQPEDSKVDIPNIRRFDNVTAWELAFGNNLYDEKSMYNKSSKSWSMFGATATSEETNNTTTTTRVIKPVDMAPSKREGIRHAFTAEALRSVGSDEVERLKQLIDSGMPADIELGGKDIYGWAIDMGALKCEELLRPVEAAKYETENGEQSQSVTGDEENKPGATEDSDRSSSFVVHRPDAEETIPQLNNRLDELESLADALSICLDNLAEEVSVCHGLLLMGGGASTLAAHVKSLRNLEYQKLNDLEDAHAECQDAEKELFDLVQSTGDIGKEIANIANFNINMPETNENKDDSVEVQETEADRLNIKAQIALSENKTRKLRASIADLSEENSRDLKEVERRGLHGGIHLVRGLREGLRDIEFNLSEARSMKTACKAKISMILARIPIPDQNGTDDTTNTTAVENGAYDNTETLPKGKINKSTSIKDTENQEINNDEAVVVDYPSEIDTSQQQNETLSQNGYPPKLISDSPSQQPQNPKTSSERIATGDSQAIAIIQHGNKGFFTVDLWNVILRIIGYDRAANRRSIQNANNTSKSTGSSHPNVMII